ncbi:MAG TPA: flagellar hook-associated protein FlgL [Oleiagrimonas sp.]|nr:flagellar hook-associated protein FlgL [Oleiagrimonas sp.]
MRVSTRTLYALSTRSMNNQRSQLLHLSQQIASGRRVVRPSDDPQAASRAVQVSQAQAVNQQYTATRVSARNALSMEENVLGGVSDAVISARTLILEAANGTLSDADRASVASQLEGIFHTLVGQANATDGNGRYLFGGYQNNAKPFVTDPVTGDITYAGGNQTRRLRVDASRLMSVGNTGAEVFEGAQGTHGFLAVADSGNGGSVTFKGPNVVDTTDPGYGTPFTVRFGIDAGGNATYEITDGAGTTLQAAQAYTPGQSIEYAGLSMQLDGKPVAGDTLAVDQAKNFNTNLFKTFEKALAALKSPVQDEADRARLRNTLDNTLSKFDNNLDNILMVRAKVGSRLNELDVVDKVAGNRKINYAQTKSNLVDLDYVQAAAEYSMRMVGLQAAQKSFVSMKGLSLFNYM